MPSIKSFVTAALLSAALNRVYAIPQTPVSTGKTDADLYGFNEAWYWDFTDNANPDLTTGWDDESLNWATNADTDVQKVTVDATNGAQITVQKAGQNTKILSQKKFGYGTFVAVVEVPATPGIIASFTLINSTSKSELDYEWVGHSADATKDASKGAVQVIGFYSPPPYDASKVALHVPGPEGFMRADGVDFTTAFYTVSIEWLRTGTTFKVVNSAMTQAQQTALTRVYTNSGPENPLSPYPNTPMQIGLSTWIGCSQGCSTDASKCGPGTGQGTCVDWMGGGSEYTGGVATMKVKEVRFTPSSN